MGTNLANNPLQIHHPVPQQAGPKASVKSDWSHVSSLFDFEFSSWEEIPGVDCPEVDTPRPGGVDDHLTVQPNQISMTSSPTIRNEEEEIAAPPDLYLKVGPTEGKVCHRADQVDAVHASEAKEVRYMRMKREEAHLLTAREHRTQRPAGSHVRSSSSTRSSTRPAATTGSPKSKT